jgi:transcriptional regulator with XRE-family HTH domain
VHQLATTACGGVRGHRLLAVEVTAGNGIFEDPAQVGDEVRPTTGAATADADGPESSGQAPTDHEFARAVGRRLRAVRSQQRLSLYGVERKSGGRWKAVVVGSYERGDRAVSVARLAELAEFYGVPVGELLPQGDEPASVGGGETSGLVLDLQQLRSLSTDDAAPLSRYVQSIQRQRGDYGNRVLSIRGEDLRVLALMFGVSVNQLIDKLRGWGAVAAGSPSIPDNS